MLKIKLLLGLFIASLLLVSCDIKNPTEGLEVRIQTISRTTGVNVDLIDGATGNPIEQTVSVSFIGDNKDKIITSSNEPITELTTSAGIAVFALEDGLIPTLDSPVYLNLSIATTGYNSVTKKIKVVKAGISNFLVTLTSIQNPTSGVATGTSNDGQAGSDGSVTDTIAVTSGQTASNDADGEATVAVPSGTQLQDKSGNNLSGTVTTTVVYTDASNQAGAGTLPGGDDANASKDGQDQGDFVPACGVDIQMQVNNQPVGSMSNGEIEIAFTLPANSVNPSTGQSYQPGETMGVYKYNAETGIWEWIKDLILGETDGGGLAAKYLFKKNPFVLGGELLVPSPGYYSFGRFTQSISKIFKMVSTTGSSGTVYLFKNSFSIGLITRIEQMQVQHGDEFEVKAYAGTKEVVIAVLNEFFAPGIPTYKVLGSTTIPDFENASSPIEITFTPEGISVPVTVSVKCDSQADNPRVISPDGFPLWARRVNSDGSEQLGAWQSIGSFTNGTLTANLLENQYYEFKTEYDGDMYYSLDYEPPFQATSNGISYSIVDDNRVCDNF